MSEAIVITLMFFAAVGFAGSGVSLAAGRAHELSEAEYDIGMRTVAVLLFFFGAACCWVASGLASVFGFGLVISWVSYVLGAQRLDVFQLQQPYASREEETKQRRIA